jgi:hypothetical protein
MLDDARAKDVFFSMSQKKAHKTFQAQDDFQSGKLSKRHLFTIKELHLEIQFFVEFKSFSNFLSNSAIGIGNTNFQ